MNKAPRARMVGTIAVGDGSFRLTAAQSLSAQSAMQKIIQALLEADPTVIRHLLANVLANVCVHDTDPGLLLEEVHQMAAAGIEAIQNMQTAGRA